MFRTKVLSNERTLTLEILEKACLSVAKIGMTSVDTMDRIQSVFEDFLTSEGEERDLGHCVAAMKTLIYAIETSNEDTMMGLHTEMSSVTETLKKLATAKCLNVVSLAAACEMFRRYVTRTSLEFLGDFSMCKIYLIERGKKMISLCMQSCMKITRLSRTFIRDGMKVLTHGYSSTVVNVLLDAATYFHFDVILIFILTSI